MALRFSRRARALLGAILLAGLLVAAWGSLVEPARLVVRETALTLPGWPRVLDGLRIAMVSDVHAGSPHVDEAKIERIVNEVGRAAPDVVVLLGDYVISGVAGGRFIDPEHTAQLLGRLRAPLGVYAVLGNHDWWFDGERVRHAFEAAGIPVLENDAVRLERGVWLIGLADIWTRTPDLADPLARVPATEPVIVLSHNPDIFPTVPARVTLTLAGHTHGGQVVLPFFGRLIVPSRYGQRYAIGHVEEDGRHLFVTPGIGTSVIPVRLGVPPEISVVRLSAAPASAARDGTGARD